MPAQGRRCMEQFLYLQKDTYRSFSCIWLKKIYVWEWNWRERGKSKFFFFVLYFVFPWRFAFPASLTRVWFCHIFILKQDKHDFKYQMLLKLKCNAHMHVHIYISMSCVSITWPASLLLMIPHPWIHFGGWRKSPCIPSEGGLCRGWCERVVLPLLGYVSVLRDMGVFAGRRLLLRWWWVSRCCWWKGVVLGWLFWGQPAFDLHQIFAHGWSGSHNLAGSGLCWRSSLTHPGGASPLPAGFVRCHRVLPRPGEHRSGEGCKWNVTSCWGNCLT